ncbi:MAG: hypothetical protein ACQEXJ_02000 [Myxococcota bacterium]
MRIGAVLAVAALLWLAACNEAIDVRNAGPRATWVAVQPAEDGIVELTLWVSDLDGDPVDVEAGWRADGEAEVTPLALAPGSHGTAGLTTEQEIFDPAGQPHRLLWDVEGVPTDRDLRLIFVPDDREAGAGRTAESPPFRVDEGLPTPARLVEQERP